MPTSGTVRCLLLLLVSSAAPLHAQQSKDSLVVDVLGHVTVFRGLDSLPRDTATATFGGATQLYSGVPLRALLERGGFPHTRLRGPALAQYLVVEGADGYRVTFGVAELDTTLVASRILVADSAAGHPIAAEQGRWRLVVAGDRGGARSVRQLTAVWVRESGTP